jgi:hypothetical protein
MPGQGVSSVFSFGKSFGVTIGVLATLGPMTFVAPAAWKRGTTGAGSEGCRPCTSITAHAGSGVALAAGEARRAR